MLLALAACAPAPTGAPAASTAPAAAPADSGADTAAPTEWPAVRINEVVASNDGHLEDAEGDAPDWIELFVDADAPMDLGGWGLSDDGDEPMKWTFPGLPVVPGQLVVVFASSKDRSGEELHTNFSLSAEGETLRLSRPDGSEADRVDLPALAEGWSYGPEEPFVEEVLVGVGSGAMLAVDEEAGWDEPGFDDRGWMPVTLGIGFDGAEHGGGEEANVALGMGTTQSSDGYGYTGVQAVDGEPSTFSHTGNADLDPWWQVDLGEDALVSSVTLINRADCCRERLYNITATLLDETGTPRWVSEVLNPVAEGAAPTDPGLTHVLAPPEPVVARAVRVDKAAVNGAYSSEWLSLGEVVVTGSPASPYAGRFASDVADAMRGVSADAFVRAPFAPAEATRAVLDVSYDDAFAARVGGGAWAGVALAAEAAAGSVGLAVDRAEAAAGMLALHGMNVDVDDDDFLLVPTLRVQRFEPGPMAYFTTPTPGEPNGTGVAGLVATPTMDPPRGFYDGPTEVTIATSTPGATLVYTLDGSEPSMDHGTAVEPAREDLAAAAAVEVGTTSILRAAAFRSGWTDSRVATHTYLFLDDVIRQPALPAGLPATWDGVSEAPVSGDYEMDPEVVDDPGTHDALVTGLREIPTLSIAMDPADLWGTDGIYINSAERGDSYERRASVELILPDGTTAFAEDVGIRVHGYGWRYHSSTKKHSFRLQWSPTYGASKLDYPWFADAPVDRFDSIVLRAGGSKTWLDFRDPAQAQYLHDAFARDTARDMGKVDGHATYVHLYLDGLYWGLYDPVERPDAGFGEEYFGGDDDEYDAINRRTVTNEAIDGTLEAYEELLSRADEDLSGDYARVEELLDIDDLIDYMLIHQYTVNRDGPCCFEHNNMRGVRRRADGEQFRFFTWDMEYSLWDAADATNIDVDISGAVSHVYARLRGNAEFRERYSERAHLHLDGDGALTPARCLERYQDRADEIYGALLAESARWGDTYRSTPYTRDVEWEAERSRLVAEFFPYRTGIMIGQLRAAGLYR